MTDTFSAHLVVGAIGSAILHSLWQGALIGALTALVLRALRHNTANARYATACLGLIALTVTWAITAIGYVGDLPTNEPSAIAR